MAITDYDPYERYRLYGGTTATSWSNCADPTWTTNTFEVTINGRPVAENPIHPDQAGWYDTVHWVQLPEHMFEPDRTLLSDDAPDMDAD